MVRENLIPILICIVASMVWAYWFGKTLAYGMTVAFNDWMCGFLTMMQEEVTNVQDGCDQSSDEQV